MRTTPSILSVAIAAAAATGCGSPTTAASSYTSGADVQMTSACGEQFDRFQSAYCSEATIAQLSKAQAGASVSPLATALKSRCATYASLAPKAQAMESCLARIQGGSASERSAQQARLPAARAKEPQIRADARYKSLLDASARLDHEALVASDNASVARQEHNPEVERYEKRLRDAEAAQEAAAANLRELFKSFGVEPQDAHAIGLW